MASDKLKKMLILAFDNSQDAERGTRSKAKDSFEVLINPDSYTLDYKLKFSVSGQEQGTSDKQLKYGYAEPQEITFEFLFDNTGIIDGKPRDSIAKDIEKFKQVLIEYKGNPHEPRYFKLVWGQNSIFKGRVTEVSITYKMFNPDGTPIRATARVTFKSSIEELKRAARENTGISDLTPVPKVKAGDTLPGMPIIVTEHTAPGSPVVRSRPYTMSKTSAANRIASKEPVLPKPHTAQMPAGYKSRNPEGSADIHIPNAGLVLLHPFLPQFFEALTVSRGNKLLQPGRALSLLHFLTSGRDDTQEHDLVLPRILCNIPLSSPVETGVALTAHEIKEAKALQKAVIHHWEALRHTSPDGLRGAFLLRPGTISGRDNDWLLKVESDTSDILLEQLPWDISTIKLPWMEKILWVEWR